MNMKFDCTIKEEDPPDAVFYVATVQQMNVSKSLIPCSLREDPFQEKQLQIIIGHARSLKSIACNIQLIVRACSESPI